MVVGQLALRSLPIPVICGSNLVIGNIIYFQLLCFIKNCIEMMKIKKIEAGNGPFNKIWKLGGQGLRRTVTLHKAQPVMSQSMWMMPVLAPLLFVDVRVLDWMHKLFPEYDGPKSKFENASCSVLRGKGAKIQPSFHGHSNQNKLTFPSDSYKME